MARRPKSKKKHDAKRTVDSAFGSIFRKIRRREPFASADVKLLEHHVYEALVTAAFAKCVEFNIAVNRSRTNDDEAFVFVAGLRGVCEDLIFLAYMKRLPAEGRRKLAQLLIQDSVAEGVEKQQVFFAANNPYQPVLSRKPRDDGKTHAEVSAAEVRRFWLERHESVRFKNPTAKHMAKSVGLESLYDYLYFATSTFVHFNPQTLLRMGWGDIKKNFKFSMRNMSPYYQSFASFYGAILFLGFHAAFASETLKTDCSKEVAEILDIISHVHRWPEVITFEEMNQRPPLYLLTHAFGRVMREEEGDERYDKILKEIQALARITQADRE